MMVEIRMCDDNGWVSHKPVNEQVDTLDKSYLERHSRLAGPTLPSGDKRRGWPFTDGEGWQCTGHAHYAGLHIRCTSPAHNVRY